MQKCCLSLLGENFYRENLRQKSIVLIKGDYFPGAHTHLGTGSARDARASRSNYSVEYSVEYCAARCKCARRARRCFSIDDRSSQLEGSAKALLAPSKSLAKRSIREPDRSPLLESARTRTHCGLTGLGRSIFSVCRGQCSWHPIKIYSF